MALAFTAAADAPSDPAAAGPDLVCFIQLAVLFACNHGVVAAIISLASAALGEDLGGATLAILCTVFTVTSLLVGTPAVHLLGPQRCLAAGAALYTVYVSSFLVLDLLPPTSWAAPFAVFGAALGGVGGGLLWPAQGQLFAAAAAAVAAARGEPTAAATRRLSAMFAGIYLFGEVRGSI